MRALFSYADIIIAAGCGNCGDLLSPDMHASADRLQS